MNRHPATIPCLLLSFLTACLAFVISLVGPVPTLVSKETLLAAAILFATALTQEAPNPPPNAAFYFVLRDDQPSPFGWNGRLLALSCSVFGRPAYQGSYTPDILKLRTIGTTGLPNAAFLLNPGDQTLIFFEINSDGNLTRLDVPTPTIDPQMSTHGQLTCEGYPQMPDALAILKWPRQKWNIFG